MKNQPHDPLRAPARRAAKSYLHPLAGDYLQECQVRELARIIRWEMRPLYNKLTGDTAHE